MNATSWTWRDEDGWVAKTRARKLSHEQEREIERRYQDGEKAVALALEFGVTANYIHVRFGPRR